MTKEIIQEKTKKLKRISRIVLLGLLFAMVFLGYRASQLRFDYDFEKFFPEANEDLLFYQDFRETFENDNDFVLIGLTSKSGIFNSNFLNQVDSLSKQLKKELPYLREVISPIDLKYLEKDLKGFGFRQRNYFHTDKPELLKKDSIRIFSGEEPIRDMISKDRQSLILIIKHIQFPSKVKSDEIANSTKQILAKFSFDRVNAMGKILGQLEYLEIMEREFLTFMIISIFVLFIFLIVTYRSIWGVFIPLLTVMLAVIGSMGIMELSGTPLNMMTTLLPVIMLVVGMSDVIHLVSKYLEEIRQGRNKEEAIKNMLRKVGVATLLTSLTTALGFITLIGVSMEPVQNFGVFTAVGVVLAFVLSILFIPAIFMLIKKPKIVFKEKIQSVWDKKLGSLFIKMCRNRKQVLFIYFLITILSIVGASRIEFDYFLMQDLDKEEPLMKELAFFQKEFGGIRPFEMAIMPKGNYLIDDFEVITELDKIETYLKEEYKLESVSSPTIPYKLINKTLRDGRAEYYKIPENKKRFDYLRKQLKKFEGKEEFSLIVSPEENLGRISGRLVDPGSREMLERSQTLKNYFEKNIDKDVISYKLTGTPVIIDESSRIVSKNIFIGLLIAFFIIALSMGLLFKSFKMAVLSLIPNLFPILLTAGFIGYLGIDLNMTTAIVFTIAFGIAVDDTIHFLSRYRQEVRLGRGNLLGLRRTFISTGKAIIITSIILLGGFGSLLFSTFLSTFYIGLFVSMTLFFAVLTDLTLLPILLLKKKKN